MSFTSFTRASLLTALFGAFTAAPASAQFWFDQCGVCQPVQPVAQAVYQTVPVTEYQQQERTTLKPVTEMRTVERQVTEYVPITEQHTADVPYVTYQNVTQYQNVTRDLGGWQTNYQPVAKMSPCQYDSTPTFGGWLNRTAYSVRASFTPNYRAIRTYQPNLVTQSIPFTRQVAVQNTRKVTYNVTRYEPKTRTETVQVPTTRYERVVEKVNVPVTVYRTVPTGTAITYAPMGTAITYGVPVYGAPVRTTLLPTPDSISNTRSADSTSDKYKRSDESREAGSQNKTGTNSLKNISDEKAKPAFDPFPEGVNVEHKHDTQLTSISRKVPSAVRVGGWRPTGSLATAKAETERGPKLIAPSLASTR